MLEIDLFHVREPIQKSCLPGGPLQGHVDDRFFMFVRQTHMLEGKSRGRSPAKRRDPVNLFRASLRKTEGPDPEEVVHEGSPIVSQPHLYPRSSSLA